MPSFAVTVCARRATPIGGQLGREEKAFANRRARRQAARELRVRGEDAAFQTKRWTSWDVI